MAVTGYVSTGAFFNTGIGIARIHGQIEYYPDRVNNTITFSSTRAIIKYVRESGNWVTFTYGPGWTWRLYVAGQRAQNSASGSRSVNQEEGGSYVGFSIGVNALDTSVGAAVGAWFSGDGETSGGLTLYFPAAGYPSGQSASSSNITVSTATISASISNWGSYCTAGTGQRLEYRQGSSGGWTTLAYSTSSSHNRSLTGLKPGTTYEVRTYTANGAGLTGYSSTHTFKTKSATNLLASLIS